MVFSLLWIDETVEHVGNIAMDSGMAPKYNRKGARTIGTITTPVDSSTNTSNSTTTATNHITTSDDRSVTDPSRICH